MKGLRIQQRMLKLGVLALMVTASVRVGGQPCANVKPVERVPSTGAGRWYLVAAKNPQTSNVLKKDKIPCGGFSLNAMPCSCSVLDVSSTLPEPFITEYNVTGSSFNSTSRQYDLQSYKIKIVNETSRMAVFTISLVGSARVNVIRALATDNHKSFMLFYICNEAGEETDIWFLSKTPEASNESVMVSERVLQENNLNKSEMIMVNQENCDYPPHSKTLIFNNKFEIFK